MVFTVGMCGAFPIVSDRLIDPYLAYVHRSVHSMGEGNLLIMSLMLGLLAILPASLLYRGGRHTRLSTPYLGGANVAVGTQFTGSMGLTREVGMRNYYLSELFGEKRIGPLGLWASAALVLALLVTGGL
jgi:ech hydrogenase subunit A